MYVVCVCSRSSLRCPVSSLSFSPCGLFRLDIILREGTAEDQQRAIEKEKLRILVGKLRAIHTSQSRALAEFHGYIWASLTVSKQMHRATWAQYCKKQLTQTALVRTGTASNVNTGGSNVLEPFTPFEKDRAVFKFLDLKTHLFALTDEVNKNQLIVITVLLRLDPDSPCLQGLQQMLGQETVLWQRQQALLVLVKQLYELESTYSATLASSEGSYSQGIVKDWDRQMHHQLDQLRKLLNQQSQSRMRAQINCNAPPSEKRKNRVVSVVLIPTRWFLVLSAVYHLKDFLLSIERSPASGRILDLITKELSLDQAELDYVTDARAKLELSQAKDPVDFYFSIVNIVGQQRHRNADPMPDRKNCCSC
jgi:hypothetical protein